jgi:gliding motility-associated-like protein
MYRKTLFIFVYLYGITNFIQAQNTFIPDNNFEQALIDLGLDSAPIDNFVTTANINTITNLDIESKNITDLTGIEDFTSLSILNCANNNLTSLPISNNINLTELYCHNNTITTINTSFLSALRIFWCNNNELTNIDVTSNTNLISLVCDSNYLNNLDTTNNKILSILSCANNNLVTLNVTENTNLNSLLISNNSISDIDLFDNTGLTILDCSFNLLTNLDITLNKKLKAINCSNNLLEQLDASVHDDLTELQVSNNTLCVLNIKNGNNSNLNTLNFGSNPNLGCIVVDNTNKSYAHWQPSNFTNYVNNTNDCSISIPVDSLNNYVGISYTLPEITNGNYFTAANGTGTTLQAGDIINTTQTIFIYNETVCDSNESTFYVTILDETFYIPKYFTPNNDGNHDFWQVYDTLNLTEIIYVFDRYGKLLVGFTANSSGWDGTCDGKLLPPSDYWYIINLKTKESLKGHFTLKR